MRQRRRHTPMRNRVNNSQILIDDDDDNDDQLQFHKNGTFGDLIDHLLAQNVITIL